MSNVVNFVCHGCKATLGVPLEMAGISGPCPFCATQVTSPTPREVSALPAIARKMMEEEQEAPLKESPVKESLAPRPWLQPQMIAVEEPAVRPARPRRPGMYIAAGLVVFAGGVFGTWKLWEPAKPKKPAEFSAEVRQPIIPAIPRKEVLASADDPPPRISQLPAPEETVPDVIPAPVTAVARNVSTSTAPAAPSPAPSPPAARPAVPPAEPVTTPGNMSPAEKEIRKVVPAEGRLEKPGLALIHFFSAPTWRERLKYTLAPGKVKPLMEQHYKNHPDGPVIPEDIQLTRIEATEGDPNRKYYAFVVFLPGLENGIPVSIEDTKEGFLVDWCSFVEAKDRALAKFYKEFRKEPGTFRVLVRRSHYFGDDIPDRDSKECLEVIAPDTTGPFHLWLDKSSAAYTKYFAKGERARWDISSMMVLTCQWEKTDKGVQYVRLREVVADSWHPALLPGPAADKK